MDPHGVQYVLFIPDPPPCCIHTLSLSYLNASSLFSPFSPPLPWMKSFPNVSLPAYSHLPPYFPSTAIPLKFKATLLHKACEYHCPRCVRLLLQLKPYTTVTTLKLYDVVSLPYVAIHLTTYVTIMVLSATTAACMAWCMTLYSAHSMSRSIERLTCSLYILL